MSSKARALFKKLRNKANEERQKERKETPEPQPLRSVQTMVQNPRKNVLSVPKRDSNFEEEIDPLDYFKTEHIKVESMNMNEYVSKIEQKPEKTNEEPKEEKESDKNIANDSNNKKVTIRPTATMGPNNHKINFFEMLQARNKIKKATQPSEDSKAQAKNNADTRKNLSVEQKNTNKNSDAEKLESKKEEKQRFTVKSVDKKADDNSQNLYVRLILARNRYNQNSVIEENVYQNIVNLVEELDDIKNLPQDITNEINSLLQKLEFPQHLILDKDVQDYVPEDQFVPLIQNPKSLDQVLKSLNISDD